MLDVQQLITSILSEDTERSLQREVGPSDVGLCRRRLWFKMNDHPATNVLRFNLPARMGTWIHAGIEERLRDRPYEVELELQASYRGIPIKGHIDLYDAESATALDWKTITKRKRAMFPSQSQRYQVHLYGWLLRENGYPCEHVVLVGLCRDGNEDNIIVHQEPYSQLVVDAAFKWLLDTTGPEMPSADMEPKWFCKDYCAYYDSTGEVGCVGKL